MQCLSKVETVLKDGDGTRQLLSLTIISKTMIRMLYETMTMIMIMMRNGSDLERGLNKKMDCWR